MKRYDEQRVKDAVKELVGRWPRLFVEVDTVSLLLVAAYVRVLVNEGDISNPAAVAAKRFFDQVTDVIHRQSPTVADLLRSGEDPAFEIIG